MNDGDLLARLKAGSVRPVERVVWPDTDVEVGIRVLNDQDHQEAGLAADRLYKDAGINVGMQNVADYEAEKTTQELWRAVVHPETGKRLTNDVIEFRRLLVGSIREWLIEKVNEVQQRHAPRLDELSDEEFDALVMRVKKNPSKALESVFAISTLRKLCRYLASTPRYLPPAS